ncbi:MAG: hypothetical protein Q9227_002735 [Pyrenula ochraceoflavens]
MSCADIFLALIAIIFPPLAGSSFISPSSSPSPPKPNNHFNPTVWVKSGLCTADSLINIALCCLGYLPGLLHAWYIIAKNPEYDYYDEYEPIRDAEAGNSQRVTYYYVQQPQSNSQHPQSQPQNYGTQQQQQQVQGESNQDGVAGGSNGEAGGAAARPPPTYAEAVRGDNKVQTS